jgi:hypothetical protein
LADRERVGIGRDQITQECTGRLRVDKTGLQPLMCSSCDFLGRCPGWHGDAPLALGDFGAKGPVHTSMGQPPCSHGSHGISANGAVYKIANRTLVWSRFARHCTPTRQRMGRNFSGSRSQCMRNATIKQIFPDSKYHLGRAGASIRHAGCALRRTRQAATSVFLPGRCRARR